MTRITVFIVFAVALHSTTFATEYTSSSHSNVTTTPDTTESSAVNETTWTAADDVLLVTNSSAFTDTTATDVDTTTEVAVDGPAGGGEEVPGPKKPDLFDDWFPLLMLGFGLFAIVLVLGLIIKRSMANRRYNTLNDVPMSFSNPIYDVALASLRRGSEGIAEAEDALDYEHQRQPHFSD